MFNVLSITTPIFFIILLGFMAVKGRLLRPEEAKPLGVFVINFALPALLFKALAHHPLSQLLDARLIAPYALGSLIVFLAGFLLMLRRHPLHKAAALSVGTSLSNSAFMGFPIAEELFGSEAAGMLAVYVFVENLLILPLFLVIADVSVRDGRHWGRVVLTIGTRLIKNPLILSMVAGISASIWEVPLTGAFSRVIDLLSGASASTALFYIGCSLGSLKPRELSMDIGIISLSKLLLHPLAVFLVVANLFPDASAAIKALTLNAAMPMATIYPLLGLRYGQEGLCSAILVVTTIGSFFSISLLLWLFAFFTG